MEDDLIQKLLFAESDFLTALQSPQTLTSYHQMLSGLPGDLSEAIKTRSAGSETLFLAHSVASRIINLASCFLDVKREEENSTTQLYSDCDALFHQMDALKLDKPPKSLCPDFRSSAPYSSTSLATLTSSTEGSSPRFLTIAHRWLLDNLHNPYPSAEVKARLAATSSCQISSVNSWFANARRRIGWTALCRERFSNCRADMLDAAYRALVEEDQQRALSPELRHSFVAMKVAAEGLYSSSPTRDTLVGDLDVIVKDTMVEDRYSPRVRTPPPAEQAIPSKVAQNSYPSPDSSITTSPTPNLDDSLTDENEEKEDVAPPIIAGSKRCRSPIDSIELAEQSSSTASRPIKRLCASVTSLTCLPSPPSSTDGIEGQSNHSLSEPSANSTLLEMNRVFPPRKRRLSSTVATGMPKRLCNSVGALRPHTASDPLLRSNMESESSIDDWFNTNFDALFSIPPPVDATEPDCSAPWEVELFKDYSIPGSLKHALDYPPVYAHISPIDLSNFDNLLQSISNDAPVSPPERVSSSDITGAPYITSFDSSTPDVSQVNTAWMSLPNGSSVHQPTICSIFPQYSTGPQPLPEIDLSMLQLPHVMPAVGSQDDFASKQVKLNRLHAMQEAVRRMEQELQLEGLLV